MLAKLKTFLIDFDKPLAPYLLTLIFWLGLVLYVVKVIDIMPFLTSGRRGSGELILIVILAPFVWRLLCEFLMNLFLRQNYLREMVLKLRAKREAQGLPPIVTSNVGATPVAQANPSDTNPN